MRGLRIRGIKTQRSGGAYRFAWAGVFGLLLIGAGLMAIDYVLSGAAVCGASPLVFSVLIGIDAADEGLKSALMIDVRLWLCMALSGGLACSALERIDIPFSEVLLVDPETAGLLSYLLLLVVGFAAGWIWAKNSSAEADQETPAS